MANWWEIKTNDAIAQVVCDRTPKCCDNPEYINQIGTEYCKCKNCNNNCNGCS